MKIFKRNLEKNYLKQLQFFYSNFYEDIYF